MAVKRAITGAEKAMARSRKRAEKGLCSKEESDAFCEKSASALRSYLDKQVKEGVITPAERKALVSMRWKSKSCSMWSMDEANSPLR